MIRKGCWSCHQAACVLPALLSASLSGNQRTCWDPAIIIISNRTFTALLSIYTAFVLSHLWSGLDVVMRTKIMTRHLKGLILIGCARVSKKSPLNSFYRHWWSLFRTGAFVSEDQGMFSLIIKAAKFHSSCTKAHRARATQVVLKLEGSTTYLQGLPTLK